MNTANAATPTFHIEPELKEALHMATQLEYHSIANMVAVLIRDYCKHDDIPMPESQAIKRGSK